MAKKPTIRFVCTNCGAASSAWAGRCGQCGEWNTLQEEVTAATADIVAAAAGGQRLSPQPIKDVVAQDVPRLPIGIYDVDNVLGGGLVPGSVVLMAGQPGIGKSTLLLQVASELASKEPILYISAEESAHQVGLRASRLGASADGLQLISSTSTDDIAATIATGKYRAVIVDSIQTVATSLVASAPGTVSQITNSTTMLMRAAKETSTALIVVGHVTKEGNIAGPKVLEHVVDVVLQLEGDRYGGFKVLRAVKNRFGPTSEAGIFEMVNSGLQPVENPSAALLSERQDSDGSIVLATLEGSRPILVEVQALVNKTSYGYPKRTASGFDLNRLNLLVAVLEKRTKLQLADQDVYINIVGGLRVNEPAADLAVALAIGSAAKGMQLAGKAVVFGEIGLSGEVRRVSFAEKRLAEAQKLGFDLAIGPLSAGKGVDKDSILESVRDVRSALNRYLSKED